MADRCDVTGLWHGRWSSPFRGVRPNSFLALLHEQGAAVGGTITERDLIKSGIHRALVTGTRSGSSLQFVKQYDGSGRLSHAVAYAGTISADGTAIQGIWQLARYHGGFVMTRESFTVEELTAEEEVAEDAPLIALPG